MRQSGKARSEAFSDGVIAVAITLLVLDLHVYVDGHGSLARQLRDQWPTYAAYVVTFFVIGVIWVNHHSLMMLVDNVDRTLLFYNLLLLLAVTTMPFATSVLADYLRVGGADARLAVTLYGAVSELMAIAFTLMLHRMIHAGLIIFPVDRTQSRRALQRFGLGLAVYPVITVIGLWSPPVMLGLYALQTAYYLFDQAPILGNTIVVGPPAGQQTPQ
ncbi:TMEM175 family protein [Jatrophihabitans telluris]|uniref:TMEM175 family protein n=1 Tax=Jatrophihabitans telluris TaxID=2038343 RepID=A0ABY4QUR9_9ACTN|nr:TMEM175 family protein [Jatrophihabitans telluris]UQX86626.1 TMEM175 family protein [Jatrophihabitans telluris]